MPRNRRFQISHIVRVLVCAAALIVGAERASAQSRILITGGADETQHLYTWQITNRSSARIVRIEFPQYGADLFQTPDNWKQGSQKEMNLVNVGWDHKRSGRCWAEPTPPNTGLAPGATATFGMRIMGAGAPRGNGTVTVKLDDGTVAEIPGVELPTMPQSTSPLAALLGTGAIFAAFVIWRERRRKKNTPANAAAEEG